MAKNPAKERKNSRSSLLDCGCRLRHRFGRLWAQLIADFSCVGRKKKRDAQEKHEIEEESNVAVISKIEKQAAEEIRGNTGAEGDFRHVEITPESDEWSATKRDVEDKDGKQTGENTSNPKDDDKMGDTVSVTSVMSLSSEISNDDVNTDNWTESDDWSATKRDAEVEDGPKTGENTSNPEDDDKMEETVSVFSATSLSSEISNDDVNTDNWTESDDWLVSKSDVEDEGEPLTGENTCNQEGDDKMEETVSVISATSLSSEMRNKDETKSVSGEDCFIREKNSELEVKIMSASYIDTEDEEMKPGRENGENVERRNIYANIERKKNEVFGSIDSLGSEDQAAENFLKSLFAPNIGEMIWEQDELNRNVLRIRDKKEEKSREKTKSTSFWSKNFKKMKRIFKKKKDDS